MKKTISLLLALVMCLALVPITAFAAATLSTDKTSYKQGETIVITFSGVDDVDSGETWIAIAQQGMAAGDYMSGAWFYPSESSGTHDMFVDFDEGVYEVRLHKGNEGDPSLIWYKDVTVTITVGQGYTGSDWAQGELGKADAYGLIPDTLKGADFTKPIARREFAAVSVKLYENLTGKKATPAATNPFTDTNDAEVLKAYNVGLTAGTAADKFSPDVLLNREQAATMLTRVLKAAYIQGWTLPNDGNYTLNFTMPAKFADDAKISDWAKPSVYFMAANKIISGTGNNNFSPRATTDAEIAVNYASATREQALAIAVRMVDNLKDKPVDYTGGGTAQQPTQPTTPPSGDVDSKLVGNWERSGLVGGYMRLYYWLINEDGTFTYMMSATSEYSYKGNYSVSGGKIYFTNVVFTNGDHRNNESDSWVSYSFDTDSGGKEGLVISNDGGSWMGSPRWTRTN